MTSSENIGKNRPRFGLYIIGLLVVWTVTVYSGLIWNITHEKANTIELAKIQARIAYEKDVIYRRWITMHGGVYVPVTEDTQPNPYMSDINDRDVTTTSGKHLTLMNPDYMMRQLDELTSGRSGVLAHITSLNPTRKENAPDQWESEALHAFEESIVEVSERQIIDDNEYMRLIRPIYTEEGCMQCHAKQVYKVGDIRGGLSVAIPMEPLKEIEFIRLVKYSLGFIFLWLIGVVSIILVGKRLVRNESTRKQSEERLIEQHSELQTINARLESLYNVSSAISRTIDLNELLDIVLKSITGLKQLNVQPRGGIFIINENNMDLVSHLGHTEEFLKMHCNVKIGDCLCGLAAKSGEIIISKNSHNDERHTVSYPGMVPHGHIVLPLKAMNKVIGVLYLYTEVDVEFDNDKINLLQSIVNQVGIVIENSRLYNETKALSLRDPLTGLANRRLMDVVLNESFAKAKRFNKSLSIILLDVDHFKIYNDTYGHPAGDKILVAIANILQEEVREIDLVVRYGGEEFLVLLPNTESSPASEIAERIRQVISSKTAVTVSLGISSCTGNMKQEELIKMADTALYQAKERGRNRVEVS